MQEYSKFESVGKDAWLKDVILIYVHTLTDRQNSCGWRHLSIAYGAGEFQLFE